MRLFLDCEYNGFKGELISMALVSELGDEWYEVVPYKSPSEWVARNVIPKLGKEAIPYVLMQHSLGDWLSKFKSIHVVADWPEDIKHFCDALITGSGEKLNTPPLTMEVSRVNSNSMLPHNALHDARAIRDAVCREIEDYEMVEWNIMVDYAKRSLNGACPLLEDQVIVSIDNKLKALSEGASSLEKRAFNPLGTLKSGDCRGTP